MSTKMNVLFELCGGPGCGRQIKTPLNVLEVYVLQFDRPGAAGVLDAWAYRFANRCAKNGAWVLEAQCWVGERRKPGTAPTDQPKEN